MIELKDGMYVKIQVPPHQINLSVEGQLPEAVRQGRPVRICRVSRGGYTFREVFYPVSVRLVNDPNDWHYWLRWDQIKRDNECILLEEKELHDKR